MNSSHCSSQEKPSPIWNRLRCRKLSFIASAQDLRCFEMENEKEDNDSPRGVLEACIRDLDTEAEDKSPVTRNSTPHENSRWRGFFNLWKKGSTKRLPSFHSVPRTSRRNSRSVRESVNSDTCYLKSSWKNFTLSELKDATNNFNQENVIGKGGYAEVYKGSLPDGQLVAIKRLNKGTAEDQTIGFLSEIGTIAHVNHPNTAKLIGFGVEGGSYLVLQLSPLGSLGSLLRGSKKKLTWNVRYKIILGTAAGLRYLHENCQRRIIHRDIKADNILLTEDFEPQICDFGLAKWLPNDWTHHNVPKFEGTFGYFAPEYFMHGIVDEKTDVFSFGVLLLELITGREALDESQKSLVIWSKPLLHDNNVKELVDPSLNGDFDPKEMDRVISTASLCIEQSPDLRPRMSQVLILLVGENQNLGKYATGKVKRTLLRAFSEEHLDAEEYNSTKYLNDLLRHREVALGSSNCSHTMSNLEPSLV